MNKDKVVILSLRVLNISQSLPFYLECWHGYKSEGMNGREAWEAVELELTKNGISQRYTSYESFKSGMSQYYSRNRKNTGS